VLHGGEVWHSTFLDTVSQLFQEVPECPDAHGAIDRSLFNATDGLASWGLECQKLDIHERDGLEPVWHGDGCEPLADRHSPGMVSGRRFFSPQTGVPLDAYPFFQQ
jgi:hypothetical protein